MRNNAKRRINQNQLAIVYVIYMMFGSYFASCKMPNKPLEERLFLHFKVLGTEKQYGIEDDVLAVVKKWHIKDLHDLRCEVRCWQKNSEWYMLFETGIYDHLAIVRTNGSIEFWRRSL